MKYNATRWQHQDEWRLVLSKIKETLNKIGHELGRKYRGNPSCDGHMARIFFYGDSEYSVWRRG